MIVNRKPSVWGLVRWQASSALFYFFTAVFIMLIHKYLYPFPSGFPSFPLTVIGGALAIFVSFRTNAAYGRWWEGRILWLINMSRHFAIEVNSYIK